MNNRTITILMVLSLICIGFILYVNSWEGSFHFDDYVYIVEKEVIRDLGNVSGIWNTLSRPTRFVGMYSFALNYHFGGTSVFGYHVVSTILHILTGIAVFLFLRQFLYLDIFQLQTKRAIATAYFAALLFLVHPINSQPVNYMCQRFVLLATLFYILALYFYLLARSKTPWYFGGVFLCGMLGMFSKETVFTLPLMILLIEGMYISRRTFSRVVKSWWVWAILAMLLIIPVAAKFSMFNYMFTAQFDSWSHIGDSMNSITYFLTQPKVVVRYIQLILFPIGLNLLHEMPTTKTFADPFFLLSVVLLGGLGYSAFRLRKKYPLYTFGIIWFFLTLSVESSFIPLRHVMFEHRCYLPSVGMFLLAASFWNQCVYSKKLRFTMAVVCLMGLAFLTFKRNEVWHDEVSLWSDVIQKSPGLTSPYTHRGMTYMTIGKDQLALEDFNQAIKNDLTNGELFNNRGNLYLKNKLINRALQDYNSALELDPTLERTLSNRGVIYKIKKQYARALIDYNRALEINPKNAATHYNKGNIYRIQKKYYSARDSYSKAIDYNPKHAKAFFQRSQINLHLGEVKQAWFDAQRAAELGLVIPSEYWEALQ